MNRFSWTILLTMLTLCVSLQAQERKKSQPADKGGHSHMHASPKVSDANPPLPTLPLSIPDLEVLDQDGHKRTFYTDLIKNKVVVVNFIFTTCKAVCPISGNNFTKLQTLLGDRLGRDVFLVSVSTDPETDSPEKLKAWGSRFKAQSGWSLITGNKDDLAGLLRLMTGDGLNKGYHVPSLYLVNDQKKSQRWAYGLEDPHQVLKMIDELAK
jgi:protein SCO1